MHFKGAIFLLLLAFAVRSGAATAESRGEQRAAAARTAFERGHYEEALCRWQEAAEWFRARHESPGLIDALTDLATAHHALGNHRLAVSSLVEACSLARSGNDRSRLIAALNTLGAVRTFSHEADRAESDLREALDLAAKEKDQAQRAAILSNLGVLHEAQEKYREAEEEYRQCLAATSDPAVAAAARVNLAEAAAHAGEFGKVPGLNEAAITAAAALPATHAKADDLTHVGRTWEYLFENAPEHNNRLRVKALAVYRQAEGVATEIDDQNSLSFALGYQGHLYEQEKKYTEALRLTRRALFLAQENRLREALYQWEGQLGRIDAAEGRRDDAIADYRRALLIVDQIRSDLSARFGNANARSSFREAAGPMYFAMADLLLQRADGLHDSKAAEACVREARDTCEKLKSVELEDYFQDECVSLLKQKTASIEDIFHAKAMPRDKKDQARNQALEEATRHTAILYFIPLPNRTEILVNLPNGLHRLKAHVGAEELTATVRSFRSHLEKRTTSEFLAEAWQLYDWLLRPVEPLLEQGKIDTLVFVPDGALRTIPMAALNDRNHFLVEKYAIAVTPGLTLMDPHPISRANLTLFASGLSESVQGFPALPFVSSELEKLAGIYGTHPLLNRDFQEGNVTQAFGSQPYALVHIASHGEFNSDAKKTFVLTYDGHLSLDALERLIRPSQLRDQPVELLALSACQTAAGDDRADRAALGLAGIAVKAGARAAFATLWFVNDEASTTLVTDFYTTLKEEPGLSKAKALQKAQIHLLRNERFDHPCLWAPYLIIGNWL